jgi:integrase
MQSRAYAALRLDDLPGLPAALKVSLGESSTKPYEPLPDGTLEHIGREAAALKAANPALWLAFQLEINAGLRRGSVVFARWDWFFDRGAGIDGERWIDLGIRVAKGRNYTVRIDPAWHDELLAVRAAGGGGADYILPGKTEAERDAVCTALVPWLRERGFAARRQPNHELRKLYGNAKYSLHGPSEGQRALGHSTPVLTSTVYSAARTLMALRVV